MIIDCDTCTVRGDACADCVVAVLLGSPPVLDTEEQQAIEVLAASGLIPPLRLAPAPTPTATEGVSAGQSAEGGARAARASQRQGGLVTNDTPGGSTRTG
ncbi:MAG TPA: hypothetical protein VMT27_01820 [Actinomycetes bacterium]|nr:hypothetical protein [Actinomycetes bacterium]